MNILVTGASGFIGEYVVREALERGHRVLAVSRSSRRTAVEDQRGIERLICDLSADGALNLNGLGVDVVVHLAASLTGGADEQEKSGIRGTENLLCAMREAAVRKIIGVSSISVLDYVSVQPMSVIDESVALARQGPDLGRYASIKARQENMIKAFGSETGNHCLILRPALVFDDTRLINAHAGIIRGRLALLVKHDGEVPVVAVEGVARAILNAIERDIDNGEIIQLVDDNLPREVEYRAGLRRRGGLPDGGIELPWRMMEWLAALLYGLVRTAGSTQKIPEALLPQCFAARLKPFRYSNAKAKRLLAWVPGKSFS